MWAHVISCNDTCSVVMTRDVLVLTVITIHWNSLHIRAGEVIVPHKSKFVTRVNSNSVPDVVTREHIATGSEQPVYRVVVGLDTEGDCELVNVGWYLYLGASYTPHLCNAVLENV